MAELLEFVALVEADEADDDAAEADEAAAVADEAAADWLDAAAVAEAAPLAA